MSLCIGAYKNNRVGQHGGLIKSGFIQNQVRVAVNFELRDHFSLCTKKQNCQWCFHPIFILSCWYLINKNFCPRHIKGQAKSSKFICIHIYIYIYIQNRLCVFRQVPKYSFKHIGNHCWQPFVASRCSMTACFFKSLTSSLGHTSAEQMALHPLVQIQ